MIKLRWSPFPEADVAGYHIYRSIIGFISPIVTPLELVGKTLQLRLNGGSLQQITFSTGDAVQEINAQITGGRAYTSISDPSQFIFRSDVRTSPGSVEIVGGTALSVLSLTQRTIVEKSEDSLIAIVPAGVDPEAALEYEDPDGVLQDWYAISTVDSHSNESLKSSYRQPISTTGAVCVIEGIVMNVQGVRVADAEVKATLKAIPHASESASHVTLDPVTTLSGVDGRYSLPLLQGALVQIEIPAVGYTRNITVPAQPFAFITDLAVDLDYSFMEG